MLLELADRILVLCGGEVSGIVDARTTDKNTVGMHDDSELEVTRAMNKAKDPLFNIVKRDALPWYQVARYPGLIAILAALIVCAEL